MTSEHEPVQAGLGFAVKASKTDDFTGKSALESRAAAATTKLTCLTLDVPSDVVLGNEPVYVVGGERSGDADDGDASAKSDGSVGSGGSGVADGYVTSAAYGYTIGKSIDGAWLLNTLSVGDAVETNTRPPPATVTAEPLFDPEMTRLGVSRGGSRRSSSKCTERRNGRTPVSRRPPFRRLGLWWCVEGRYQCPIS